MPKDEKETPGLERATKEAKETEKETAKKPPKNRAEFFKTFLPK